MTEVFLSYCGLDRGKVAALADALSDHGLAVWWDKELVGGDHWKPEIAKKLGEVDAVVVLWTPNSVDRPFVKAEAAIGLGYDCLLSVHYARDVEPPEAFGKIHAHYLGDWNPKEKRAPEIGKLVAKIQDKKTARDRQKRAEALPEFEKIRKKAGPVTALFGSALPGGLAVSSFLVGVTLTALGADAALTVANDGAFDQGWIVPIAGSVAFARAVDQFMVASRNQVSVRFFDRSFSRACTISLLLAVIVLVGATLTGVGADSLGHFVFYAVMISISCLAFGYALGLLAVLSRRLVGRL